MPVRTSNYGKKAERWQKYCKFDEYVTLLLKNMKDKIGKILKKTGIALATVLFLVLLVVLFFAHGNGFFR
jgi:hypothetical protein